ncbi:Nucleotidyltransferase [Xylaria scruposa]|nr:Nucleotidyltransferase [Xylaria scruposa]
MATGLAFPTIFLLPTHFQPDELPELEGRIPTLTYNINEAKIILGKVAKKRRAILELRSRKLFTDEIQFTPPLGDGHVVDVSSAGPQRPAKRGKPSPPTQRVSVSGDSTASDTDESSREETRGSRAISVKSTPEKEADQKDRELEADDSLVQVVRLAWFTDSLVRGEVLPVEEYLVYQGRKKAPPLVQPVFNAEDILKRAREDASSQPISQGRFNKYASATQHPRSTSAKRPRFVQESTSEHERAMRLPPVPDYMHSDYSCQRPTPLDSPNSEFIEQLKKMRTLRTLEMDDVGIRAYSTSIAAVAAYPYPLSSASEVDRLPGCGPRIVELYKQWKNYGYLEDVQEAASNPKMRVLLLFYDIWGVGAKTANDFYKRGWRDLDDIVEHGWDDITRVQQIGVKYYEELQKKIPRAEVEGISKIILEHANKIRAGFQMVIVGGYRRGKASSGDVDVLLSHPDLSATDYFINEIVASLEGTGHITHTLTLSSKNSERGQAPLAWKGENRKAGSGFDTLDKALVVWQDPNWDRTNASKNPNPHRRVDIIVSPWKTAGCAVVGWTGGTTFERDLRRYCKKVKQLKFDSSGVRMRENGGDWVDLESDADGNPAPDMLTAEKTVFERLGLTWIPPEERCTG